MKTVESNCPCCNHISSGELGVVKDYIHFKCPNCNHEFFTQISSSEILVSSKLYQDDADYINDLVTSKDYHDLIQWNHLRAASFFKKKATTNTILDIGTYNGFFVKYLRDKGYEAYGYDFNEDAIRVGIKNYGLDGIITSSLSELKFNKFDCITAFEVIEHLETPKDLIDKISELLKDDGCLILSCPNNKMLWRPPLDFPPHHLSRFNPTSISLLIEKSGYKVISVEEQMSFFDLIRNFIGVFFRNKNETSLKGGQFKKSKYIDNIKTILNKSRIFCYFLLFPVDKALHILGVRYISQVIIAKKIG